MHTPANDHPTLLSRAGPWLLKAAAAVVLALVFAWYLNPHFVVDMAARFWSCI